LAESGATVAVVSRNAQELEEVQQAAKNVGARVVPFVGDVVDTSAFRTLVATVEEDVGAIDILVNSAGTNIQQNAVDVDEASWDAVIDVNLRATFFACQAVGRSMINRGRPGRIINIASQIGEVGFYKRAAYAASKGGLVHLSKVLALEWAPLGIRVNCVGPTFVDTPLARQMLSDPEIAKEVLRRIPVGRLGLTSEVAAAVIYLASEGADIVTGHHLLVDGGWTAQ
jgi:2-deoxy-D-gluconate 3-dehydrogenase